MLVLFVALVAATLGGIASPTSAAPGDGPLPAEGVLVFADPVVTEGTLYEGRVHVDVVVAEDFGATRVPREGLTVELGFPGGQQEPHVATTDAAGRAAFQYETDPSMCDGAAPEVEVRDGSGSVIGHGTAFPGWSCWGGDRTWIRLDGVSAPRYDWLEVQAAPKFAGARVMLQQVDPKEGETLTRRRGVVSDLGHAVFRVRDRDGRGRLLYVAKVRSRTAGHHSDPTVVR